MPIVKIRSRRQVTLPKSLFDEAGFQEGGLVEITRSRDRIVIRPRKRVAHEDTLAPEEGELVRQGEAQIRRGKSVLWEDVKKKLRL